MAELDAKRSAIFLKSWFCCIPSRPKRTEFYYVKPMSNLKEEEYDYVVEKLSVKKVPVSLFEDSQHENAQNNISRFPSRSSSDYEDTSEKCLAVYNLNSNNDSRSSEIRNEDNVSNKKDTSSSHSTLKRVSAEYLKKCNLIKMVRSKLRNTKRNTLDISTFSNNFQEDIVSRQYSSNSLKTNKKCLKMDTFGCNYYIEQDKTALVEQKNKLQSSCLIQKTSNSKIKCDQSTQTFTEHNVAILQDHIKVTASTNTETSQTALNKSVLTNGALEPIKINLTLSTVKNKERNSHNKECQTENKSSILRLNDIINSGDSIADISQKYSHKNQYSKYSTTKIPINYSENDIPEKESGYCLMETVQENFKLNPVSLVVPSTNFFRETQNKPTLKIHKKCMEEDQVFNYFPERDTKSSSSNESNERNMAFDLKMSQSQRQILLRNIEDLQNAKEDISKNETNAELSESDSQFSQSITLSENNLDSSEKVPPYPKNVQEIRNVNIPSNSPFCSMRKAEKLKNIFLKAERPDSPRLTEIQRIAELASSENNPIKWKIVIKQRKVPEQLQKN